MTWRERVLHDGTDREGWLAARESGIGASDVKSFAKLASVDRYVAAKIRRRTFHGNEATDSGHRWEPMILAFLGVPANMCLVHAPGNRRLFATPDGISEGPPFTLAEAKTRHGVIKPEPDVGEWRQLAAQLICFPEARRLLFGTLTLVRDVRGEWTERKDGYSCLEVTRDHPRIVAATEQITPIVGAVLGALTTAQQAMKEVTF